MKNRQIDSAGKCESCREKRCAEQSFSVVQMPTERMQLCFRGSHDLVSESGEEISVGLICVSSSHARQEAVFSGRRQRRG